MPIWLFMYFSSLFVYCDAVCHIKRSGNLINLWFNSSNIQLFVEFIDFSSLGSKNPKTSSPKIPIGYNWSLLVLDGILVFQKSLKIWTQFSKWDLDLYSNWTPQSRGWPRGRRGPRRCGRAQGCSLGREPTPFPAMEPPPPGSTLMSEHTLDWGFRIPHLSDPLLSPFSQRT